MVSKKDPICGMKGHIHKYDHYFCSDNCVSKYESKYFPYKKIINYGIGVIASALLVWLLFSIDFMTNFMGIVLILLAFLQLQDLKGFATAFANYDFLARKSRLYGLSYPFIELALGFAFVYNFQLTAAAIITLIIFGIGTIGVINNLMQKNPVKCACLGTKIKIPLTKFTLFEDLVMVAMSIMILL